MPSSFEPVLAHEPKRKLAISLPRDGWVALIESKEVIDFALARTLSEKLKTTVLAIQVYETSGAAGFVSVVRGQLLESQFNEADDSPIATVRETLRRYKVPFDVTLFHEAVQCVSKDWRVKQKTPPPG